MKGKGRITIAMAAALSICFAGGAMAQEGEAVQEAQVTDLGSMTILSDRVAADGENSVITSHIKGITDSQGRLAIPLYEDAVLTSVQAGTGTLKGEPAEQKSGVTSYLVAEFEEPEAEAEMTLVWNQEGSYKMKAAKTSGTAPGNLKAVKYSMVNTAPISIDSYTLEYAVPQGYELAGIVGYDPEEEYRIFTEDGVKYGSYGFGEVSVGQTCDLTINIKPAGGHMALSMWAATVLISAFFLYKNKGMLKEAGELARKKKLEKQGGKA